MADVAVNPTATDAALAPTFECWQKGKFDNAYRGLSLETVVCAIAEQRRILRAPTPLDPRSPTDLRE